ncbi:FAD-dependent oxidoreductase, partial [Streptomyces sp. SID11233]|nr:FAD-dependent oxidoreductase [Streptomyces sp. SID11233]
MAVDPLSMSLGYHQFSAAVRAPGTSGAITPASELWGAPGTRVAHAVLRGRDGEISTLDLCAGGFCLLAAADGEKWVRA